MRFLLSGALCAPMLLCATTAPAAAAPKDGEARKADGEKAAQNFPESAAAKPAVRTPFAYPTEAAGEGTTSEGFNAHRWAEDWRSYKDPKKRDDLFDRLKYLPLAADGDVYLTLSGEARARFNHLTNPGLTTNPAQDQELLRLVGGADLHLGTHFRLFGELASGQITGENIGVPAANLHNDLFAQQYFAEATANVGPAAIGARYGRQEFADGAAQLVSQRDNNSLALVLNGIRGWARTASLRADVFDLKFTTLGSDGLSDDRTDDGHRFSGVTFGYALPRTLFGKSKLYFDPFVWRFRSTGQSWGGTTATEVRNYLGARLWGSAGDYTIDWTVTHQTGHFGTRDIDATQFFLAQSVLLSPSPLKPRLGFHVDYGTGDNSRGTGTLGTAAAPFGNTIYFAYTTAIGPTNLRMIAPTFAFAPAKTIKVATEYSWAMRDNLNEPVYRGNATAYARTAGVEGRDVAQIARLQVVWTPTRRLSFTGRYEHLFTGEVFERAGYTDYDFLALWTNWRF